MSAPAFPTLAGSRRVFDAAELQGGTIIHVDQPDARARMDRPVMLAIVAGGRTYHVEVWQDEEGNGPGHLMIERLVVPPSPAKGVRRGRR